MAKTQPNNYGEEAERIAKTLTADERKTVLDAIATGYNNEYQYTPAKELKRKVTPAILNKLDALLNDDGDFWNHSNGKALVEKIRSQRS